MLRLGPAALQLALTPFDSGHCPGSAAFLLECNATRVLHTGDWRRDPRSLPDFLTRPGAAPLDRVYLDNTFCHPSYAHPERAVALRALLARVEVWRDGELGRGRLLLGVDALGKEELLEAVAAAAGGLVAVTRTRLAAVRALGLREDHLTTWPAEATVLTAPRWRFGAPAPGRVRPPQPPPPDEPDVPPVTLALLPTGWPCEAPPAERLPPPPEDPPSVAAAAPNIAYETVPYSLHASFSELRSLMEVLAPVSVVGLVAAPRFSDRPIDPVLHFAHLLRRSERPRPFPQPLGERREGSSAPPPPLPRAQPPPPMYGLEETLESMMARVSRTISGRAMGGLLSGARRRGGGTGQKLAPLPSTPSGDLDEHYNENEAKRSKL
jgi:DNA cross-link repair 1B protein